MAMSEQGMSTSEKFAGPIKSPVYQLSVVILL